MALKRTSYTDADGRIKVVLLPEEEDEANAPNGVPVGPPSLGELELPLEVEVRLNNELFHRGILTTSDAKRDRAGILQAIQATLKLNTERVFVAYAGRDYKNASKESPEVQSNKAVSNRRSRQPRKQANVSRPR